MKVIEQIKQQQTGRAVAHLSVSNARIPQTYANAKSALSACVSLDECKGWSDKAAALASYAKQAEDDEMMRMATRIRDRAIRRAGELLKQIEPKRGGDRKSLEYQSGDAPTLITRAQAASDAGMSRDQMHTALRLANIPADDFERQVESDEPPTVTALAKQGTKPAPKPVIDLKGRDPGAFNRSMHFVALLQGYAKEIRNVDLDLILPGLVEKEADLVRAAIASIDAAHDRIITRI
jgi:hypothetical protein